MSDDHPEDDDTDESTDHVTNNLGRLDDEDYPAVTMGQAAELLGVQPAFLRSLDTGGALRPHRTEGGHRRYSRRQLALAARLRELLDAGHTLTSALAIADLEGRLHHSDDALGRTRSDLEDRTEELDRTRGQLREARAEITDLQRRLDDET
jgi:MerR family transcriptional regulator/heat shock protein HspR